jgi:glycosyltransferase involved in cell wall biosynthesis
MFFWVHTHGYHTAGISEVLKELKKKKIPSVGYHLDLWLGLERQKDLKTDPYWGIEYFFSVDKLMVDFLNADKSLPKAWFLPAGVFEDECYLAKKNKVFEYDVVFVGSRDYHREWQYRQHLIKWLEQTYGSRFAQFGRGGVKSVRGDELNQLYASAKVVVGDTLCIDYKYPYYLSDRIFETTGRGGFIIHPYIKGIDELYNIQVQKKNGTCNTSKAEIITYPFNDFEYLKYLIDYFVENGQEREEIRKRGFEKTKKEHTYTNRLKFIINTINGL